MHINGHCDARFLRVKDAFAENFSARDEIGASVSIVHEGKSVVDLWGGYMDGARTRPWQRDTVVNVWSLGKAMTALALLTVMDEGVISPDTRLIEVWPEFAAAGKADITFRMVMSHRAGLCGIEAPLPDDAYLDWDTMTNALVNQAPWWEPGTAHGYHTNTIGFLMGEPVRRITGKRIGEFFRKKIATPLAADFHIGVPANLLPRCADLVTAPRPVQARTVQASAESPDDRMAKMRYCIYNNPSLSKYDFNSAAWRGAEFPSTSPQANARAVATIFGELAMILGAAKPGVVSRETLARAVAIESDGEDLNILRPTRFGLGFQLTQPDRPLGPNPGTFGHYGNGGHLGFADPEARLGFAYHMNHQGYAWRDPRNIALTDAMYESL